MIKKQFDIMISRWIINLQKMNKINLIKKIISKRFIIIMINLLKRIIMIINIRRFKIVINKICKVAIKFKVVRCLKIKMKIKTIFNSSIMKLDSFLKIEIKYNTMMI